MRISDWSSDVCSSDLELAVGLALIRCKFCQELVIGDARRRRETGFRQYARADFSGRLPRRLDPAAVGRNVEIGFVQRERLDQVGIVRAYRMNLPRAGLREIETRRD